LNLCIAFPTELVSYFPDTANTTVPKHLPIQHHQYHE